MTWDDRFRVARRHIMPAFSFDDWNAASCWASCPVGEQLTTVLSHARTHSRARALGLEFWRYVGDDNVEGAANTLNRIKAWRRQLYAAARRPRKQSDEEDA